MKFALACFIVALLLPHAAATVDEDLPEPPPSAIFLRDSTYGHWATLARYNTDNKGYDPHYTVLATSWRPVVTEISPRRWQITFEKL